MDTPNPQPVEPRIRDAVEPKGVVHSLEYDEHNITVAALRFVALNVEALRRDRHDETAGEWWIEASAALLSLQDTIEASGFQLDPVAARYDQPMWWSDTDLSDMRSSVAERSANDVDHNPYARHASIDEHDSTVDL